MKIVQEYDGQYRFKDYAKKMEVARKDDCESYVEYIVKNYVKIKSMNDVAKKCDLTFGTVKNILNALPKEIKDYYGIEIRKKGGRTWSKLTDDDVRFIRSHKFMNIMKYNELAKEISKRKTEELGYEVNITSKDVQRCYTKKTHKDIV